MGKIGMELALLYFQYREEGAAGIRALRAAATRPPRRTQRGDRRPSPRVRFPVSANGERVTVDAVAAQGPDALLSALRGLGMEDGAAAGNLVSGRLPIAALDQAARLSSLRGMTPSVMRTHAGRVRSEADTTHRVVQVREDRGLDGTGQKICALSDSYNNDASALTTARTDIESGDLPGAGNPEGNTTPVDVLDDEVTDERDEGRAMLQLIHDLAPGAELGFHTAFKGVGNFAQGIRELADAGCTVIVDDVGSSIEPFYQDGPVSNAVDDVVSDGVPYFSSAGNDGQNSYEAPFRNSGRPGVLNSTSVRHDFDPSLTTDTEQSITVRAGGSFTIFTFQWTDPSEVVEGSAGPDTDLDIALVNAADSIVAQSARDNLGSFPAPVESMEYTNESGTDQTLDLVVEKAAGPDPDEIKYIYFGTDFQVNEYDTLGPTIYGHPMAEGAMAVAAAPFFNTAAYNSNSDPATLASFSSKGGIPILFDQSGNRLSTPVERQKPDVTGTDGIDNTFFGFDLPDDFFNGVDADPHPNFFGTSAAAPNVAAIAALIKEVRPGLPPTEVYDRLESTAADITDRFNRNGEFVGVAEGVDPWSGHGFVQAPEAVPVRDIFDVQLAETADPEAGTFELTWRQRDDVTIDNSSYQVERRYFDGPFEPVSTTVTTSGEQRTAEVGALGLGVFQFRIQWTRSDGTPRQRTTRPDTLGFQGVATELRSPGEIPNPQGRRTAALSWTVPAGTQGFSYDVERRRGADGPFEVLATTQERRFDARLQAPGQYTYRITARDGQGNSLTSPTRTVEIDFEGAAVAIGPYPNPVRETATLDLTVDDQQAVTVEVYNTIGERVFRDQRQLAARTATALRVDAGRWSSGVYFLRVRGEGFSKTRKLVVVK
jgi:hypothetical protein